MTKDNINVVTARFNIYSNRISRIRCLGPVTLNGTVTAGSPRCPKDRLLSLPVKEGQYNAYARILTHGKHAGEISRFFMVHECVSYPALIPLMRNSSRLPDMEGIELAPVKTLETLPDGLFHAGDTAYWTYTARQRQHDMSCLNFGEKAVRIPAGDYGTSGCTLYSFIKDDETIGIMADFAIEDWKSWKG